MKSRALHPLFAAEVTGCDLRQPLTSDRRAAIEALLDRHAVLVFPDQPLTVEEQVVFSGAFGPLEITNVKSGRYASPHVVDLSNTDAEGRLKPESDKYRLSALANQLWHTDSSFKPTRARYSLLAAQHVPPEGGETEFADLRAAYDALPAAIKARIDGLWADHSIAHSRRLIGVEDPHPLGARRPLAERHPGSGRMTLYLAAHAYEIVGWPVPEGRLFLMDLIERATERRFVYSHAWRAGDLVIWDNRCTMHRGRPYDPGSRREMRRTTVEDRQACPETAKTI